jgi:hypothetical protein
MAIRFCLVTLAVIGVTGASALAASADPATFCLNGQYCQDSTMTPLNTSGITARAFINFHRHTSDGSQITIDVIKVDSVGQPCDYVATVTAGLGGDRLFFGSFPCNEAMPVNVAFARTAVVTIEVVGDNPGQDVLHNLTIRDFCSNPAIPCKHIPPPA